MNGERTTGAALAGALLAASFLAASFPPRAAAAADCSCKGVEPAIEACRVADWHRAGIPTPKTRDDLEALLDDLTEGSDTAVACFMKTGCFKDEDDIEVKLEPCTNAAWGRYAGMLDQAHDRMTKIGALAQVYGSYADEEPPPGVEKRLVSIASRILAKESDPIVVAVLLKELDAYDFDTPEMVDQYLQRMTSDSELLREMAFGAFQRVSNTTLPFEPQAAPETRARQVKDLKEWWSHQSHEPRDAGDS